MEHSFLQNERTPTVVKRSRGTVHLCGDKNRFPEGVEGVDGVKLKEDGNVACPEFDDEVPGVAALKVTTRP